MRQFGGFDPSKLPFFMPRPSGNYSRFLFNFNQESEK